MTVENMRKKLYGLAETDYKDFNKKLLPGVEHIIGIRLPAMRSLAKETAKEISVLIWMKRRKRSLLLPCTRRS